MKRAHPPRSGSQSLKNIVPYQGQGSVLFQLEHMGVTVNALHQVNLFFRGLAISTVQPTETGKFIHINYRGYSFWVQKPDLKRNSVSVRCSCPDFYFTFSYWNWAQGAIFGVRPRPYRRKTTTRPPRNPGKHPGCCKHCLNSFAVLFRSGLTQSNNGPMPPMRPAGPPRPV